jgi:hypothetical protein
LLEKHTIAAVIKDVPANSHLIFKLQRIEYYWGSNVYVQLIEGANTEKYCSNSTLTFKADPNLAINDTYKVIFRDD